MQLCSISGTVWAFLEGVKNSGSPLPRSVIVARCQKDSALLTTICQVARSALILLSVDGNNKPKSAVVAGADRILSFFTATVIEVADKGSLDDTQLRTLYPFLLEGLKKSSEGSEENKNGGGKVPYRVGGPADQWRRSSCMIIAQICRKTRLAKPLLKNIIGALMYSFVQISGITQGSSGVLTSSQIPNTGLDAALEIITIVSVIAQSQKVSMGPKMLLAMFSDISESSNSSIESSSSSSFSSQESNDNSVPAIRIGSSYLLQCIEILQKSKGFDASALIKCITTTLTAALVYQVEEHKSFAESSFLSPMMASKILAYCIASGMLAESIIGSIVWKILQNNSLLGSVGQGLLTVKTTTSAVNGRKERSESFSDDNDGDRKEVLRVLRCVSQRYPTIFDSCVQAAYNEVKNDNSHTSITEGDEIDVTTIERVLDEDDKDDEDELLIGLSLSDIRLKQEAKASSLRQLLSDTFTHAPYRMPNDNGVSLIISLSHTSSLIREAALETFTLTVPLVCESTPDVRGLAQAASLLLTDSDHLVAISAWNVNSVIRISSHITSQEFFECAFTAFNYWLECTTRLPVRASKVLSAILLGLSESSIAKIICSSEIMSLGSVLQGDIWLFVTVLTCAMDVVLLSVKEDNYETEKGGKRSKALQYTALLCAKLLGDNESLPLFSGISSILTENKTPHDSIMKKKNKSKNDNGIVKDSDSEENLTFDLVAKSIALCLCGADSSSKFQSFHRASLYFSSTSWVTRTSRSKNRTFISFLDSISSHLIAMLMEETTEKTEILKVLQFITALSTSQIIHFIRMSSAKTFISLAVITALKNIITRADIIGISNIIGNDKLENVPDIIIEGSKNILANDIGGRIILSVLSSEIPSIAALAGLCLGHFYGNNPSFILYRVALSSVTHGGVQCDDLSFYYPLNVTNTVIENTDFGAIDFTDSYLEVSPKAKAGAISALSQYISAFNTGVEVFDIDISLSSLLIAIVPLLIGSCCDENKSVRSSAILLGQSLKDLRPQFQLTSQKNKNKQSKENSYLSGMIPMTIIELITFGHIITSSAAVILLDSHTMINVLSQKIFSKTESPLGIPGFPTTNMKMKTLSDSLLSLGTFHGWSMPFISIPVLTAASAAPLEMIWSYVQNLLSLESSSISSSTNETKNFSYKKLSKAIIRCISTAHTASNEVQSSVMKSVCQIIEVADRTDGTYTRDEIFHLLGEGWATKFSNEDRSALFRSLLKEQVRTHEITLLTVGICQPLDFSIWNA